MVTLSFDEGYVAEIRGSGGTFEELETYYGRYATDSPSESPSFTCTVEQFSPTPEVSVGDPNLYYGRDGDRFLIEDTSSTASLSRDWTDVRCTPDTSKNTVAYLLEYGMRKRYAEQDLALIHASGVDVEGTTLVFPAWRHTGKTNLMLSLLQEYGGGYLSDDRVWVHSDGSVTGYDLPVNMMPYNVKTFSDLGTFSMTERLAAKASNVARWYAHRSDGLLPKAASFTNIFYLEPAAARKLAVSDLLPDVTFKGRGETDAVVLLRTAPEATEVRLREATPSAARRALTASSHYEWNGDMDEYCQVFDSLFPEEDECSKFERLLQREAAIFDAFLERSPIFELAIPREERWAEKGIGEQALDRINEVIERV